ncbi:MAG: hypothetical protein ALECFALPRED_004538 [Alectoria fallacina]|uniref:Uncharacterized protein n=1 Tax=Alectoria fallacina TaxID=1903189 RepID=A0A8H3FT50_9LECA|nr:MAG: hypothetical protein ALECFALPRED_004538 [Alectoria fallacina]
MSSISLLGRSTEIYADAAAFGIHIFDNHSLFEGEELFEGNPIEDLYDQVYTLRRWTGEPIAHMPMNNNKCPRCAEQGIEQDMLYSKGSAPVDLKADT